MKITAKKDCVCSTTFLHFQVFMYLCTNIRMEYIERDMNE